MMTTRRRVEPVLSRTPGGYRPAHTSAADSSVQPFAARVPDVVDPAYETGSAVSKAAPKAATRGFKQRAFERRPYVIPQADLEAAAAHIAQARDESQTSHTGDAPKRKTYLCRGVFTTIFGILAVLALSAGSLDMTVVFMVLCGLCTRIGPDDKITPLEPHEFGRYHSYEDSFGKRCLDPHVYIGSSRLDNDIFRY